MSLHTIANRYARALADVMIERGEVSEVHRELERFVEVLKANDALLDLFENPVVPVEKKREVLGELLKDFVQRETTSNFLRLLLENHRLHRLEVLLRSLERELDERSGIVSAEVTTARPITDQERELLRDRLHKAIGREVRLKFRTDPAVIGGVVTRIGSTVYDGSIRNQLAQIREQLVQVK